MDLDLDVISSGQRSTAQVKAAAKHAGIPTLIFVRHGATAFNSGQGAERARGWLDLPLTKEGIAEAKAVAEELAKISIVKIYTSDLRRATAVATAIRKAHPNHPPISLAGPEGKSLNTWNIGEWAGKYLKSILPKMVKYEVEMPNEAPPGGESSNDFRQRTFSFVKEVIEESKRVANRGAIILSTHASVLRAVDGWIKAGMQGLEVDKSVLKNAKHLDTGEALQFTFEKGKWNRKVVIQSKGGGVS